MRRSAAGFARLPDPTNVADAHTPIEGRVQVIRRYQNSVAGPAGGI